MKDTQCMSVGVPLNSDQVKILDRLSKQVFGKAIGVELFLGLLVKLACTHPKTIAEFFENFHEYCFAEGIEDGNLKMDVLNDRIKLSTKLREL
jgi:branched-subunit amino acid permease